MVFKLFKTLASNSDADPRDVKNVKSFLGKNGFIKSQKDYDPYPNSELFGGIKKFQRKNGLKVDGEMKPNGETETEIAKSPSIKCPGFPKPYMEGRCGNWHKGAYSPKYCDNCYIKGVREGIMNPSTGLLNK